jgi:hypothetical protein
MLGMCCSTRVRLPRKGSPSQGVPTTRRAWSNTLILMFDLKASKKGAVWLLYRLLIASVHTHSSEWRRSCSRSQEEVVGWVAGGAVCLQKEKEAAGCVWPPLTDCFVYTGSPRLPVALAHLEGPPPTSTPPHTNLCPSLLIALVLQANPAYQPTPFHTKTPECRLTWVMR